MGSKYVIDEGTLAQMVDTLQGIYHETSGLTPEELIAKLVTLTGHINDAKAALAAKGVDVPEEATPENLAGFIGEIAAAQNQAVSILMASTIPILDVSYTAVEDDGTTRAVSGEVSDPNFVEIRALRGSVVNVVFDTDSDTDFDAGYKVDAGGGVSSGNEYRYGFMLETNFEEDDGYVEVYQEL